MSQIIFNAELCRQELVPLLIKSWKAISMAVDRNRSDIEKDYFRLLLTIQDVKGLIIVTDSIQSVDLPARSLLCVQSTKWFLPRFLQDHEYRKTFVYDAFDAALATLQFAVETPNKSEIELLDLERIKIREDLARASFAFIVHTLPQNGFSALYSSTELVSLRRILTEAELRQLWEKCSREETWRDRQSLL